MVVNTRSYDAILLPILLRPRYNPIRAHKQMAQSTYIYMTIRKYSEVCGHENSQKKGVTEKQCSIHYHLMYSTFFYRIFVLNEYMCHVKEAGCTEILKELSS